LDIAFSLPGTVVEFLLTASAILPNGFSAIGLFYRHITECDEKENEKVNRRREKPRVLRRRGGVIAGKRAIPHAVKVGARPIAR
jgi:hypothetical protein